MILILPKVSSFWLEVLSCFLFCSQQADSFISGNLLCMMMRNIGSITIHWDSRGIVQNKSKPNPETSIRPTEYKSIGPADSLKLAYSSKWIYPARFPELNCLQMGWFFVENLGKIYYLWRSIATADATDAFGWMHFRYGNYGLDFVLQSYISALTRSVASRWIP